MHTAEPHRNSGPKFAPGKVVSVTFCSILISMQVLGLGLVSRVSRALKVLIHQRRENMVRYPGRTRLHNPRGITFEVRTDSVVQMVESAFQQRLQPKQHLPYPTGLPKDISHVEILPPALHGRPRTLHGVARHRES